MSWFDRLGDEMGDSPVEPRMAGGNDKRRGEDEGQGTAVITRVKPQTKRPNLYRVLLLNDDYTPMEFVVQVLEKFFNRDRDDATRTRLQMHHTGAADCVDYTVEV